MVPSTLVGEIHIVVDDGAQRARALIRQQAERCSVRQAWERVQVLLPIREWNRGEIEGFDRRGRLNLEVDASIEGCDPVSVLFGGVCFVNSARIIDVAI